MPAWVWTIIIALISKLAIPIVIDLIKKIPGIPQWIIDILDNLKVEVRLARQAKKEAQKKAVSRVREYYFK
jgi:hypothetical protein